MHNRHASGTPRSSHRSKSTVWRVPAKMRSRSWGYCLTVWCFAARRSLLFPLKAFLFPHVTSVYRHSLSVRMTLASLHARLSCAAITSVMRKRSCTCPYSPMRSVNSATMLTKDRYWIVSEFFRFFEALDTALKHILLDYSNIFSL